MKKRVFTKDESRLNRSIESIASRCIAILVRMSTRKKEMEKTLELKRLEFIRQNNLIEFV